VLKPKLLKGPHFAAQDRLQAPTEADLAAIRKEYFDRRPTNLQFLLRKRYEWMGAYLQPDSKVVEFGTGLGLTREFIDASGLILTDVDTLPWIDQVADAINPAFAPNSLDAAIYVNVIHHLATPLTALKRIFECIRPGGYVLVQDAHPSLLLRSLMWAADNEGWSFEIDVWDENAVANDPNNPWSGNVAIPYLLFHDKEKLERALPGVTLVERRLSECFVFPLSGGVIQRTRIPSLPTAALKAVNAFDNFLISLLPNIFALGVSVVMQKKNDGAS